MTDDLPPIQRWESKDRYYHAGLERDLLGDLVVVQQWGGRWKRLGGEMCTPVGTLQHGLAKMEAISLEREKKHYRHIGEAPLPDRR